MAVNKVIAHGETLIDLTGDSVTPESLLAGYTAHQKDGEIITGTHVDKGSVLDQYVGGINHETVEDDDILTYTVTTDLKDGSNGVVLDSGGNPIEATLIFLLK